jgi:two-component system, chemotaxis family, sensor kinase CheA
MDKELADRLLATFITELQDHVRILERDLLALERNPDPTAARPLINTLFRSAHSLKGAARAVELEPIEALCHRLEEIFASVRDNQRALDAPMIRLLLTAVDGLKNCSTRLHDPKPVHNADLAVLLAGLAPGISAGRHHASPAEPEAVERPIRLASAPREPKPAAVDVEGRSPASEVLRVSSNKLDKLVAHTGELLVMQRQAQARLEALGEVQEFAKRWRKEWQAPNPAAKRNRDLLKQMEQALQGLSKELVDSQRALSEIVTEVNSEVRNMRMIPFSEACEGLERMVRDLAQATGKQVTLRIEGADIEIDRSIMEGLKDPLRHLVRNAIDHGIGTPQTRALHGKPPMGIIIVKAALRGTMVEISVEDNGRGLLFSAIREHARALNLADTEDEHSLTHMIFLSGFSTSSEVTKLSGRGVGLDVVKSTLEAMRGSVEVETSSYRGTRFILTLPLTLSTIRGLVIRAAGRTFAFDGSAVERLLRVERTDLKLAEGCSVLAIGDELVRIGSLADTLGLKPPDTGKVGKTPVVVLSLGHRRGAFLVDELLSEQEIVIQSLGPRLRRVRYLSGATVLSDGTIAPILNAVDLLDGLLYKTDASALALTQPAEPQSRRRLIVVDDSITTRMLEKNILEAAGYEVRVAADGAEAWRLIQQVGADLVVSDVEMPNMDGFTLTETIRSSKEHRNLPVILVTALANDRDRARGLQAGADAYIVKASFDQRVLLESIAEII